MYFVSGIMKWTCKHCCAEWTLQEMMRSCFLSLYWFVQQEGGYSQFRPWPRPLQAPNLKPLNVSVLTWQWESVQLFLEIWGFKDSINTSRGTQGLLDTAAAVVIVLTCPVFDVCTFFPFLCGRMQPMRVFLSCWWETRLIFVSLLLQRERSASQRTLEKSWPW